MASGVHDIVLLDSDSEPETARVKRSKPAPRKSPSGPVPPMAPFTKAFMQDSESDTITSRQATPDEEGLRSVSADSNSGVVAETTASSGLKPSLLTSSPMSSDLYEIGASDSPVSNEDQQSQVAMQRTIYETRKFLKQMGPMAFLQEYLPTTASSENILKLILKLGFYPRDVPPLAEGENLLQLIKLLHLAMKRVRELRSRLEGFHTIEHVLQRLKSAKKILVITGAGISTSLGIPDFRSSAGFYSQISDLGLSDPQEVFDLEIFHTEPAIFYLIAHMILPPDNVYAPLHKFIKLLQDKGKLLRNYTQNIDDLESNAGISREKMIQCHGSFAFARCVTCGYEVAGKKLYPTVREKNIPYCPKCAKKRKKALSTDATIPESYGVMKPNITFFGEALPKLFHNNINKDLQECDLVISIGTSLKVAPVAEIVDKVRPDVPQILINRDNIHHCNFDVSLLGYCDDVVSYLCDRLGDDWNIDHPDYKKLAREGNLVVEETEELGLYKIKNMERERKQAETPSEPNKGPDLVVLLPTIS